MDPDDWLTCLYETHKRVLLLVAWNIVNQREMAEDVVHGAMLRLAELPNRPEDARAFAIQTVCNFAIDVTRKQRLVRYESWDATPCEPEIRSAEPSYQEQIPGIQMALQSIDVDSRETVRLQLQAGFTFREISELLDQPLQTVASRYRRAIAKLRSILETSNE